MSNFTVSASSINMPRNEISKESEVEKTYTGKLNTQENSDSVKVKHASENLDVGIENIEKTVANINDFMNSMQSHLSFHIDKQLEKVIVSVIDDETDEVIRQIPSEDLVVLLKKMDGVKGMLFDRNV
ncbi:flagellar protein FlaG [Psychromonas sp. CD1]|uniref:flagellar protein FlaG n=1 Tax=Psychromonas sp. CD1 TaxID=1979839 RepID=UPI000B9BB6B0|nr:flagellar protein FlaG [Psychromonas sp. CD1]